MPSGTQARRTIRAHHRTWIGRSLAVLILTTSACKGGEGPTCAIISAEVSPASVSVGEDQSAGLSANVNQTNCSAVQLSWSVSSPSIATVQGAGSTAQVTGVAAGTASVVVTAVAGNQTATGQALVTVTRAPVASISITPSAATVESGRTQALTAELRSASNRVLSNRTIAWSSSDPTVATVAGTGNSVQLTAIRAGVAVIAASSEGRTANATITVTPAAPAVVTVTPGTSTVNPGRSVPLQAEVKDAAGNVLTNANITWTSANPNVVTVAGAGAAAVVTGVAPGGPVAVTARAGTASGVSNITVINVPVATVVVQPTTASVTVGNTTAITARTVDAAGSELLGRPIAWTSSNVSVATVSGSGNSVTVTGVATGSATITASSEGKSAATTVQVSLVPVASVTLQLAASTINVGATTTATVTLRDASGATLTGRALHWTSSNANVANMSNIGPTITITGTGAGTSTIGVSSEGRQASAVITVTNVPIVVLVPARATMSVGREMDILAMLLDANRNPQGATFLWQSSNTNVATVSVFASRRVVAVGPGTATITATVQGTSLSASIPVTVGNEFDAISCAFWSCYSTSKQQRTWSDAKSTAATYGGLLVSPTSTAENNHVNALWLHQRLWIGLSEVTEPLFVFEDDEMTSGNVGFSAWGTNQPFPRVGQDCAYTETSGLFKWYTAGCNSTQYNYLIEWGGIGGPNWISTLVTYNGHRYAMTALPTSWPQANALANMLGGHLVKIETAEENAFLTSQYGGFDQWIGLNDRAVAGQQRWTDNTAPTYTNWDGGQPDHAAGPLMKENCAHLWVNRSGRWNDNMCSVRFHAIIEWDTLQ